MTERYHHPNFKFGDRFFVIVNPQGFCCNWHARFPSLSIRAGALHGSKADARRAAAEITSLSWKKLAAAGYTIRAVEILEVE